MGQVSMRLGNQLKQEDSDKSRGTGTGKLGSESAVIANNTSEECQGSLSSSSPLLSAVCGHTGYRYTGNQRESAHDVCHL